MRRAISLFLKASGVPLSAADRLRTPERVAEAWAVELLGGYAADPVAELTWEPAANGKLTVSAISGQRIEAYTMAGAIAVAQGTTGKGVQYRLGKRATKGPKGP